MMMRRRSPRRSRQEEVCGLQLRYPRPRATDDYLRRQRTASTSQHHSRARVACIARVACGDG